MKKINPELARDELWRRGDLSWKFHAGQRAIDAIFRKIARQLMVCNISRQFGKTIYSVIKVIELSLQKPGAIIRYGTAQLIDLMRFIIPAFKTVMEDCPEDIKGKLVSQRGGGQAVVFPNTSRIELVGIDKNPDAMRGNSLDMVVVDEAAYVDKLDYLYQSVIVPSTVRRPNCKILMVSSAPDSPDHPFKSYCDKAEEEKAYIKLTIYDHPNITEQTIQRLADEVGGKDTTTFKREFLCEFISDGNLAIIPEWKDDYIKEVPRDEFFEFYHRYTTMDIGYRDLTANLFTFYDFKKAILVVEDEIHFNGPQETTETLAAKIKQKEIDLWGDLKVHKRISDNNNLNLLHDMNRMYNLPFTATDKTALQAMVNKVRIMVNAGRILINPRCEYLIGCLRGGIWDSKKVIFARNKKYFHYDHLAALIYLVRNLDEITNPIPPMHGLNPQTNFMPNLKNKTQTISQSAQNLAAAFPRKN